MEVSCSIRNHGSEGRYEAGDRRAMAHDCTRSCSGRTSSRRRRGSPSASLAVEESSSGSFGSGRTAGYAIGEGTHITLAGGHCRDPRTTVSQAGLQARAGSPDPSRGTVWSSARIFTGGARDSSKHPFRAPKKVGVNPFQARKCVRGNPVCGAIQCAGQSSVQARCAGQFFKLVVLSVGRSTLSYVVGSTVPVLAAERLHNERFNECQGR